MAPRPRRPARSASTPEVPAREARGLDAAFVALADPTRRRVIQLLGRAPRRASELAEATAASRPGMSRHLRILREAGLVREESDETDARARLVHLSRDAFGDVKDWLETVETFWAEQLESFGARAEARAREAREHTERARPPRRKVR
jgi:DNA-binding transcriptional ArsR family regulator